jgi:cytochrome c
MDSFEFNKIAGAVLGTALAVFGIGELTGIVYHTEAPALEHQGYKVATAEEGAPAGGEATPEAAPVALAELLRGADPAKGQATAKACLQCHAVEKGGPNKIGPGLWDIVDRPIAAHEGFAYSEAMKAKAAEAKIWSWDNLNAFLTKPSTYVPKTKMVYPGLKDADRANVLAYLQSLSDAPKPFPAP